jgi:biopolymer transport protein TolR
MVSAPLITTGIVDLPSVGKARQRAQHVIEIVVGVDERLKVRVDQGDANTVGLNQLAARIKDLQAGNADTPVVIAADRNVKYEQVVKVMDVLQRAGVQRVGLAVKQAG